MTTEGCESGPSWRVVGLGKGLVWFNVCVYGVVVKFLGVR